MIPYETPETTGKVKPSIPLVLPQQVVPEGVARTQAEKYSYAIGGGQDEIYNRLINGQEDSLRQKIALDKTAELQKDKQGWLEEIARLQEGPLSPEQFSFVQGLTQQQMVDPKTVFESEYAQKMFGDLFQTHPEEDSQIDRAQVEDPVRTSTLYDIGAELISKQELVKRRHDEGQEKIKKMPWISGTKQGGYLDELLGQMIPFRSWTNLSKNDPFLQGAGVTERVRRLMAMPLSEFQKTFNADYDEIYKTSPLDAQTYAEAVASYSSSDELWGNVNSLLDLSSIPGIGLVGKTGLKVAGKAAGKLLAEVDDFGRAVRTATKANAGPTDVVEMLARTGKTEDAAVVQALKNSKVEKTVESVVSKDPFKQLEVVMSRTPSFMDPHAFLKSGGKMAREQLQRLETLVQKTADVAKRGLMDRPTLTRLSDEQTAVAFRNAIAELKLEFPHINNSIIDIFHLPAEQAASNVDHLIFRLSHPSGEPFKTKIQAGAYAKNNLKLTKGSYDFGQHGADNFSIDVLRSFNETEETVRDAIIQTGNETPVSGINTMLGRARGADALLAEDNMQARKRLVHGIQRIMETQKAILAPIQNLPSRSKDRLERFATMLTDTVRKQGVQNTQVYATHAEFETAWQDAFGKLPTVGEAHAYYSYLTFYDLNYAMTNMQRYAVKAREGMTEFKLTGLKTDIDNPYIEGRFVPEFDPADLPSNAKILVYSSDGQLTVLPASQKTADLLNPMKTSGYKAYQIANWSKRPLMPSTGIDDYVNYVFSKSIENRPLSAKQLEYKPGGPVQYNYRYKIAQARITEAKGRRLYDNDATLSFGVTEKQATATAKLYEEARLRYVASLESKNPKIWAPLRREFNDFVDKNLPISPADLRKAFEDGRLSKSARITWTQVGKKTVDESTYRHGLGDFEDVNRSALTLGRDTNKEHAGEHGFDIGGLVDDVANEPLFPLDAPRVLDPLSTVTRAATSMARSAFFDDYRRLSAEKFAHEFNDVMLESPGTIKRNPIGVLYNPSWNEKTLNRDRLQAAKNYQKAVTELMNVRTPYEKNVLALKEKLYNTVYDNLGEKTADFLDDRLFSKISDPVILARSAVFHAKLGVFNPRQLFQQAQTLTHVMSLVKNPVIAEQAMVGYNMRFLMLSQEGDKIINHFAGIAQKLGWKREDFKEAYDFLRRSGIMNVEGEQVLRDNLASPVVFRGKIGSWWDKGNLFFFREGEKMNRLVAFNAAYLEWRSANPLAKLNRRAEMAILRRQDDMTVNMTRASSASWQKGFLSVPTQFFSYQTRLLEQMVGKRLTSQERARILLTYSAMYGVPIGIGGTLLPIYPWYEDIREARLKSGQSTDNLVIDSLHHGLVSTAFKMATGEDLAWGESMGPRGLPTKQMFDGRFLEVLFGAVGATGAEGVGSMYPVIADIQTVLSEGPKPENLRVTAADLGDAARIISTVNSGFKLYYALNYGKAYTRGDVPMDEVSALEGTMMSVFGVNPNRFEDMYAMIRDSKDIAGAQKAAENQMVKYFRRGFNETDEATRWQYYKQAEVWRILGGVPADHFTDILKKAAAGNEDMLDNINRKYFLDALPGDQKEQGLKTYMERTPSGAVQP